MEHGRLPVLEVANLRSAYGRIEVLKGVSLDVQADNDRALDLYRRFGFEVAVRTPVLALPLRGGGV